MNDPTVVCVTSADRSANGACGACTPWLQVESLDQDAQGVARTEGGKVVFIEGALPFEHVSARIHRCKNNWEQGILTALHRASSQRVVPHCPHFGLHPGACGGCKLQHLHPSAQVAMKQRLLEDTLWHLGKVRPCLIFRPVEGTAWGYRYRARLSVRHVPKKNTVLVGFHERKSSYVANMTVCPVLPPHVSAMLLPLRSLILSLDAVRTCPQIELACGDTVTALVLRHLEPLSTTDQNKLRLFASLHPGVQWWLQPGGPETVHLQEADADGDHDAKAATLRYTLPEFGVVVPFKPTDFTQVNPLINQVLVSLAIRQLDIQPTDRVIDWFCGLGNFTLPMATRAREVLGVEGSAALVGRARTNYQTNQANRAANRGANRAIMPMNRALCATVFESRNLFAMTPERLVQDGVADKWLLDPPREGAFALVKALAQLHQPPQGDGDWRPPNRIVYVSCNPATLARDAGLLVHQAGYRCAGAGVVNMFAHTAHVESIAVFDLESV